MTIPDMSRALWRKSSYSAENGACVEVAAWRESTYSDANGGAWVEMVGKTRTGVILVRDTTNRDGLTLSVPATAWKRFADALK